MKKNPMDKSFDKLFKQIADVLHFVQENSEKPFNPDDLPPTIFEKLNKLREDVDKFKRMGDEFVDEWNDSKIPLMKKMHFPMGEVTISKEDRLIIDRANQLKSQVEKASKKLAEAATQAQGALPQEKEQENGPKKADKEAAEKDDSQFGNKRKRKFKRFGSKENWRPL